MNKSNEKAVGFDYINSIFKAEGKSMNEVQPEQLAEIYKEIASVIGVESTLLFYASFKGQQVSFPSRLFSKEYIRDCITKEYDGTNVKSLSKKYGYSERWVREILGKKSVVRDLQYK